jgi:hypothetical protein
MKPTGLLRGILVALPVSLTFWAVAVGAYWAGQEGGVVRAVAVFVAGTLALAASFVFAVALPVVARQTPRAPQRDLAVVLARHGQVRR